MKTLITVSALALVGNMAMAGDFAYERQIGSEDVSSELSTLVFRSTDPAPSMGSQRISLHDAYRGNPDTEVLPADFEDSMSMDMNTLPRTSYEEISRGNHDLEV